MVENLAFFSQSTWYKYLYVDGLPLYLPPFLYGIKSVVLPCGFLTLDGMMSLEQIFLANAKFLEGRFFLNVPSDQILWTE